MTRTDHGILPMRFWRLYRYFRGRLREAEIGPYLMEPRNRRKAARLAWAYARKGGYA